MGQPLIIGVDFDGTIVEHEFPEIGYPVPGAIRTLQECVARGARIVLWTMRSDSERAGPMLSLALDFLRRNGIEPWGVNANPEQSGWTSSPKAYCHVYVDDAALGCPLRPASKSGGRPMVDWDAVAPRLFEMIGARR